MGVKVGKLWGDSKFNSLDKHTKLLYIYLVTNPNLNTVGVFLPNIPVLCTEFGVTLGEFRGLCQNLVDVGFLYAEKVGDIVYFILPKHFNTIPKSESSVLKIQKDLTELPSKVVSKLKSLGITIKSKVKNFEVPTVQEVNDYAISQGYLVQGEDFVNYYNEQSQRYGKKGIWVDSRGKQVRDWKGKLRNIWFKDENKLKQLDGAPKGFEFFHVKIDGKIYFPDSWKDGKPKSRSFAVQMELDKEYETQRKV